MEYQAGGRAIAIRFPVRLIMRRTAKELAEAIGARLEGDGAIELAGIAAPERAGARDLIYVDAAKHAQRAAASAAACVIAAEGVEFPGKTVLRSAQPKVAFARAAELLPARAHCGGCGYRAVRRDWRRCARGCGHADRRAFGDRCGLLDRGKLPDSPARDALRRSTLGEPCRDSFGSGDWRGWFRLCVRRREILEIPPGGDC